MAVQLVKSTAVYKKYKKVMDKHRATSPSLSPIGASPDLIASMIMPCVENSSIGDSQSVDLSKAANNDEMIEEREEETAEAKRMSSPKKSDRPDENLAV